MEITTDHLPQKQDQKASETYPLLLKRHKWIGSLESGPSLAAKVDAFHPSKQLWLLLNLRRSDLVGGDSDNAEHQKHPPTCVGRLFNSPPACGYLPSLITYYCSASASPCEVLRTVIHLPVGKSSIFSSLIYFIIFVVVSAPCCSLCSSFTEAFEPPADG